MNTSKHNVAALREHFLSGVRKDAASRFDDAINSTESPIEALFLAFVMAISGDASHHRKNEFAEAIRGLKDLGGYGSVVCLTRRSLIVTQLAIQVGGRSMRIDFALRLSSRSGQTLRWIAVELDGHDFHERTKEQAASDRSRDRLLTADGWMVLRFTGSEIHADVESCWSQVATVANEILDSDATPDHQRAPIKVDRGRKPVDGVVAHDNAVDPPADTPAPISRRPMSTEAAALMQRIVAAEGDWDEQLRLAAEADALARKERIMAP